MNIGNFYDIIKFKFYFGGDFTKKLSKITFIVTIIAEVMCCLILNTLGGIAFIMNDYDKCGIALFISTVFLVTALIFIKFKKTIIPLILTIVGTGSYIYTLAVISAIPNAKVPKESTEVLLAKHYPTIAVTVLLILLIFFNFFSEEAVQKRLERKNKKLAERERSLNEDEKII